MYDDDDEVRSYCNVGTWERIRDKYKSPKSNHDYLEEPSILAILVLGIKMVGVDNFYKCLPPRTRTTLPDFMNFPIMVP